MVGLVLNYITSKRTVKFTTSNNCIFLLLNKFFKFEKKYIEMIDNSRMLLVLYYRVLHFLIIFILIIFKKISFCYFYFLIFCQRKTKTI